jgi:FolB domain-containing protein
MSSSSDTPQDVVFVRNVAIQAKVGLDCWQREKPQPVIVSLRISTSTKRAGASDKIEDTMDYRKIYKFLTSLGGKEFSEIPELAFMICGWDQLNVRDHELIQCTIELPKALRHSEGVVFECSTKGRPTHSDAWIDWKATLLVRDLRISCIIGIGEQERIHKQPVIVNLKLEKEEEYHLNSFASHLGTIYEVKLPNQMLIIISTGCY